MLISSNRSGNSDSAYGSNDPNSPSDSNGASDPYWPGEPRPSYGSRNPPPVWTTTAVTTDIYTTYFPGPTTVVQGIKVCSAIPEVVHIPNVVFEDLDCH